MRVVLDTSVIVSGLISPHGKPAEIIHRWYDNKFTLLYTQAMLEELEDVLNRTWLRQRFTDLPNPIDVYLEAVTTFGEFIKGNLDVSGVIRDEFDEMFLICAKLGQADYLVSVDKDLLSLVEYEHIPIITPAQFLAIF